MSSSRIAAGASAGVAAALLVLAAPATATAHVSVDASSALPGSASTLAFTIEHGCDGSPTTGVSIAIPEGVVAVTPVANAGWTIDLDLEGSARSMTYTAQTPLPSPVHDTIVMDVVLGDDLAAGAALAFPVEQTCEAGSLAWTSLDGDAEHPAPVLTIAEPQAAAEPAPTAVADGPFAIAALVVAVVGAALATIALRRQAVGGRGTNAHASTSSRR